MPDNEIITIDSVGWAIRYANIQAENITNNIMQYQTLNPKKSFLFITS